VQIPDIFEAADISESENDYVLPYTTISPHKGFHPIQDFSGVLGTLREHSKQRVQDQKEFKKVFEAMEKIQKEKSNTTLSLKIEKPKLSPSATPTAAPGATTLPSDASKSRVILDTDVQLREGAAILIDSIELMTGKSK
jgi:C-terminal domain of tail specific protease (DUF3340)